MIAVPLVASIACTCVGCPMGLLGVALGAGDKGPYLPGTLATELGASSVRTLGCLDVGLVPFERPAGGPRPNGSQLVDVHVGNRCTHPEAFDLARVAVRGRSISGEMQDVALSDPRREIAVLHVGGAERGLERVRLEGAEQLAELCFDLQRVAPEAAETRPAPLCFTKKGDVVWTPADGAPVVMPAPRPTAPEENGG